MICSPRPPKACGRCLPSDTDAAVSGGPGDSRVFVLRPAPGNRATLDRLAALGVQGVGIPLFETVPIEWTAPDPDNFDALMFTSANAVRLAGDGLARLRVLPVLAVGDATAQAAREAGFDVMATGDSDAQALLRSTQQSGIQRALHLGGRESMVSPGVGSGDIVHESIIVYASDPAPVAPDALAGVVDGVALLHSPRAAQRFAALVDASNFARNRIILATLSPAITQAAGEGWRTIWTAPAPTDSALTKLVSERHRA